MKIKIIAVGKMKKEGGFSLMQEFYRKRISHFARLEIVELKEASTIKKETENLIKFVTPSAFNIALREEGKTLNTLQFATILKEKAESGREIRFFIGGAYGFEEIGENMSLSVAPWTLPHQLARIVLMEQIYRGLSIIKGRSYHHG